MPTHICTHRCNHTHACMHTKAQSCVPLCAHIGTIKPTLICVHRQDHAHAYMPIIPTRICTYIGAIMPIRSTIKRIHNVVLYYFCHIVYSFRCPTCVCWLYFPGAFEFFVHFLMVPVSLWLQNFRHQSIVHGTKSFNPNIVHIVASKQKNTGLFCLSVCPKLLIFLCCRFAAGYYGAACSSGRAACSSGRTVRVPQAASTQSSFLQTFTIISAQLKVQQCCKKILLWNRAKQFQSVLLVRQNTRFWCRSL